MEDLVQDLLWIPKSADSEICGVVVVVVEVEGDARKFSMLSTHVY